MLALLAAIAAELYVELREMRRQRTIFYGPWPPTR